MVRLLWVLHNHQPIGNFDFIFQRAYERAYRPFLDVLKLHRGITVSLHFSGILLDWLETHQPHYVDEVGQLVREGRVEILGGAYYEAVLPSIPDRDKSGQLQKLQNAVHRVFGVKPQGAWLAERVWEPALAERLVDAGFTYVVLDAHHLKLAGHANKSTQGWFFTEEAGKTLRILPIDGNLRDLIPFRPVDEVVAYLRGLDAAGDIQIVFGDDGEKLGDWPFTHESVYGEGWLEDFFTALESHPEEFRVQSLCRGFARESCRGLVYIPAASYPEMGVWAQSPGELPEFLQAKAMLAEAELPTELIPGSSWRQFLIKYSESNAMHKQMLRLSREIAEAEEPIPGLMQGAREELWRSQCNCAYWHGVFGGLYLPHLRNAVYRSLISCQKELDKGRMGAAGFVWESRDWNLDGHLEYTLNTPYLYLSFNHRAEIDQFWLKATGFNLCDSLRRRPEPYHLNGEDFFHQTDTELIYDKEPKAFGADRYLSPGFPFEPFRKQDYPSLFRFQVREILTDTGMNSAHIRFLGALVNTEGQSLAEMEKSYTLTDNHTLDVAWRLRNPGTVPFGLRLVSELLFCLLAGWATDRFLGWKNAKGEDVRAMPASNGEMPLCRRLEVFDQAQRVRFSLSHDGTEMWRYGQQTVSRSESGAEAVYQGTVVLPVFDVELESKAECSMYLSIRIEEGVAV